VFSFQGKDMAAQFLFFGASLPENHFIDWRVWSKLTTFPQEKQDCVPTGVFGAAKRFYRRDCHVQLAAILDGIVPTYFFPNKYGCPVLAGIMPASVWMWHNICEGSNIHMNWSARYARHAAPV
jgi:hypothetical protein